MTVGKICDTYYFVYDLCLDWQMGTISKFHLIKKFHKSKISYKAFYKEATEHGWFIKSMEHLKMSPEELRCLHLVHKVIKQKKSQGNWLINEQDVSDALYTLLPGLHLGDFD